MSIKAISIKISKGRERTKVVHIFAVVRVPVVVSADLSDEEAVEAAVDQTNLDREIFKGEYADEINHFLVDHRIGDKVTRSSWLNKLGKPMVEGETAKILTLSTAHMTFKDSQLLEKMAGSDGFPSVGSTGSGFVISLVRGISKEVKSAPLGMLKQKGFSSAFLKLWSEMHDTGFGYLQLDCDAGPILGYRTFNW